MQITFRSGFLFLFRFFHRISGENSTKFGNKLNIRLKPKTVHAYASNIKTSQ